MTKKREVMERREVTYLKPYLQKFIHDLSEKTGESRSKVIANCIEAVKKGSTQTK